MNRRSATIVRKKLRENDIRNPIWYKGGMDSRIRLNYKRTVATISTLTYIIHDDLTPLMKLGLGFAKRPYPTVNIYHQFKSSSKLPE